MIYATGLEVAGSIICQVKYRLFYRLLSKNKYTGQSDHAKYTLLYFFFF